MARGNGRRRLLPKTADHDTPQRTRDCYQDRVASRQEDPGDPSDKPWEDIRSRKSGPPSAAAFSWGSQPLLVGSCANYLEVSFSRRARRLGAWRAHTEGVSLDDAHVPESAMALPVTASLSLRPYAAFGGSFPPATGFVVKVAGDPGEEYFLVTNRHVVTGRRSEDNAIIDVATGATPSALAVTFHDPGAAPQRRTVLVELSDQAGSPIWREHPGYGSLVDVAVIPLSQVPGSEVLAPFAYELGHDASRVDVASEVYIIGYPEGVGLDASSGLRAIWVRGTVAWPPIFDWHGLPRMLVDCRARPGQSGSPAVFWSTGARPFVGAHGVLHQENAFALVGVYSGRLSRQSCIGLIWRRSVIELIIQTGREPAVDVVPMDPVGRHKFQEDVAAGTG